MYSITYHYITFSVDVAVDRYVDKNGNKRDKFIELRFIHSFKFMASSLDSLTNNLVRRGRKLIGFEDYTDKQYELLMRKVIYPYKYMTCWDKFKETQLPPIQAFCSNLNMSNISNDDYKHAQRVWSAFSIHSLGEYHDLYLCTDVILLSNMFEAFRDTCLEHYKLDPAHFYTFHGLAWKACLKKAGVRLVLLTDPDMLLMFEHGIRGGITKVVYQYACANNIYMDEKFNPLEESCYLQYLHANNLSGWAMSQQFPAGGFRWVDVNPNDISRLTKCDKGYLLEIDVSYLKDLHIHIMNSHLCVRV